MQPDSAQAFNTLGNALAAKNQLDAAIAAYEQGLGLQSDAAEIHNNLANALRKKGKLTEALRSYRKALTLRPDAPEPHNNLGNTLRALGNIDEAITHFQAALQLRPQMPSAWNNLGIAMKDIGRLDDALDSFGRAMALRPDDPTPHSNRVYTLYYHPGFNAQQILAEHQQWNRQHAARFAAEIQPYLNDRSPDRPLHIGYISPNFCDHCQALFMLPLLSHHDPSAMRIFCYSDVVAQDTITHRLQKLAQQWRSITGLPDERVAEMVRADQIDVLVDLSLHMAHHRLLVFARKPAPIQVSWLGYPGTTGLKTIDYRLTDPFLDLTESPDNCYSEKSVRLPETFWCYDPLNESLAQSALPALQTGHITFGCLNNFCKINDAVLELWAKTLTAVARSRLILLAPPGSPRQRVLEKLSQCGIESDRVEFVDFAERSKYLELYHRIDIGLDTFPYNGHTTTLDSLWMGVPVITLIGNTAVGRAGFSQLSNLKLAELAPNTPESFVQIAADLASNLPKLTHLRATLRQRMSASPLMDAPRFARNIESAYRKMWHYFVRR
jgi:predicted O-linked N-acetylglucosamine transferase (SPINDLY family)